MGELLVIERENHDRQKWEHILVRVVDESPFVEEAMWAQEEDGFELVAAYPQDGCVRLYFKRPA